MPERYRKLTKETLLALAGELPEGAALALVNADLAIPADGASEPVGGYTNLTSRELNALAGEELPERAAASLVGANVVAPTNLVAPLIRGSSERTASTTAG
jgi:hypothetical protein